MTAIDSRRDTRTSNNASKDARRAILVAAVLGAMGSAATAAQAATLFWDADGDASATVGGSGNWLGGATWRPGSSTGSPLQAWNNANNDDAVQPGTGTITVGGPVTANSFDFAAGSSTVAGAGQLLTLGSGGVKISGVGTHTISADITAAGGLNYTKNTAASSFTRLTLSGTNNFGGSINWLSPTPPTSNAQHRIEVTSASAIPAATILNFHTTQSQFQIGTTTSSQDITLNGAINLNASNTGTTLNQYLGSNGSGTLLNRLIINGPVSGQSHLNFLAQNGGGGGQFVLNSAMTYTGDTTFNTVTSTGHTRWGINNALPTTTNLQVGAATGTFGTGALDLAGFSQSIASLKTGAAATGLASAGIVNTGANTSTLTITGNQVTTYNSTIGTPNVVTQNLSGPNLDNIALVLSNTHSGSLALTRHSFYQGGTTVSGGTLLASNNPLDGSATGSGAVTVNAGGAVGGSGRIAGAVTLNAGNATFNPGGLSAVEDIQLDNGLTLSSGNVLNYDFSPSLNDKIVINGNVNLPSGSDLIDFNLNNLGGLVNGTYELVSYTGTLNGDFATLSVGAPGGATYTLLNNTNSIALQVAGAATTRTWTGATNATWDVNISNNWTGSGSKFLNGDQVSFDDSGANTTITVAAAGVSPGLMTFANNGATYTIGGPGAIGGSGSLVKTGGGLVVLTGANTFTGAVNLGGGTLAITSGNAIGGVSAVNFANNAILRADGAVTTSKPMDFGTGGGTIDTNGNAVTASGALSGAAGALTKTGAGTLTLSGSSPSFSGGTNLDGGTLRVTAVSGGDNVTGVGTGAVNVNNGGTFHIDNISMGTSTASSAASIVMNTGSTLLASGTASYGKSGGFQVAVGAGTVNVNTASASDTLTFKNSLRRTPAGGGDTNATIRVGGPGRIIIESGPVSSTNTYSGAWDVASGILQVGPVDPNGFGEALNGLGFKDADPKNANTVTVSGGTLAGAVNTPNPNSSAALTTPNFFRANLVMSGGTLASSGLDSDWGGDFTTQTGTTSQVLVADPVTAATPRNVNLVAGAAGANNNAASTNWNGNLVVTPGALATGGSFNINRDGGTVTVTPGASLQINSGATVNLSGTADALSDGTDHVDVVNNGTFDVTAGTKNVGNVGGAGDVNVSGGATVLASHFRGGNILIDTGSTAVARASGGVAAGASKVNSITIAATGKFDLKDNKLIVQGASIGTATGGTYNGLQGEVQRAFNGGAWDQPGLTTSMPDAAGGLTTIGVATGEQIRGLGPTDTDTFAGQTINGASAIAMYTYAGDANLDGAITGDDYSVIDFNIAVAGADGYYNGDFNYDGIISGDDYSVIDFNIVAQGAPFPTGGSAEGTLAGVTAVPEPASACGFALLAAGLLARRRRRSM